MLLPSTDKTRPATKTCSVVLCAGFLVTLQTILESDCSGRPSASLLLLCPLHRIVCLPAYLLIVLRHSGGGTPKPRHQESVVLSLCVWSLSGLRVVCLCKRVTSIERSSCLYSLHLMCNMYNLLPFQSCVSEFWVTQECLRNRHLGTTCGDGELCGQCRVVATRWNKTQS